MLNNLIQQRMLLSHNFNITTDVVAPLEREEFALIFHRSLGDRPTCQTRLVNHPHWIVEVLFHREQFLPQQIGKWCAQALADYRLNQGVDRQLLPVILVLGGLKVTPPTNTLTDGLQTGDWGVDVVETLSSHTFLDDIGWNMTIASKPVDEIFKVELKIDELR